MPSDQNTPGMIDYRATERRCRPAPCSEAPNVVMATALQMCRDWAQLDMHLYANNGAKDIAEIMKHRLEIIDAALAVLPNE